MLFEQLEHSGLKWINIEDPTEEKMNELAETYGFHELDIEDCFSETERPKIDEYDDYMFVVMHMPAYDKKKDRFRIVELNIFIGDGYLITVSEGDLEILRKLFDRVNEEKEVRGEHMSKGSGFLLYRLTSELFEGVFPMVEKVGVKGRRIERDLFEGKVVKDMLYDIMGMKRQIITLRRIMQPHRSLIMTLEHKHKRFLAEELEVYFDDVVDKIEKIWGSLEVLNEVADTLQDANEALVSHNTNNVIKILTVFSVVMLPLTFVTGLYGMNVALPGGADPITFRYIVAGLVTIVVGMMGFFVWKKWI
jgi:magnesium transporter